MRTGFLEEASSLRVFAAARISDSLKGCSAILAKDESDPRRIRPG